MLIKSDIAKQSLPFPSDLFIHDHWLTINASFLGKISYIKESLVKYRIHNSNQIGINILNNIFTKEDYINIKLDQEIKRQIYVSNYPLFTSKYYYELRNQYLWIENRISFLKKMTIKNFIFYIKYSKLDIQLAIFEFLLSLTSSEISKKLINIIKKH
jgi:hypothetical protein